jgi:hypothetical protein
MVARGGFVSAFLAFLVGLVLAFQGTPTVFGRILVDPVRYRSNADGTVLHVNHTTGDVYISLTSNDNVRPGMPFDCFDPRTFGTGEATTNGSVEVMAVTDTFTRCRITSTVSNRAIQVGDVISSFYFRYDKEHPAHFAIIGDFDLDGDGVATAAERDRIVALIRAWGGVVDNTLTRDTAYLVAGRRPLSPILKDPAGPGTVVDQRTTDQKYYDELLGNAKDYPGFITILNTNRFLALIGYYGRTTP